MSETDTYLLTEHDELVDTEEKRKAFALDNDGIADWALLRWKYWADEEARIKANAKARIDKIKEKLAEDVTRAQNEAAFFDSHLKLYAYKRREASPLNSKGEPIQKSFQLPSGTLSTTYRNPIPKVVDQELAVKWAKANNREDLVETVTTETVDLAGIKEINTGSKNKSELYASDSDGQMVDPATGEPVEGVIVTPGELSCKITAGDE